MKGIENGSVESVSIKAFETRREGCALQINSFIFSMHRQEGAFAKNAMQQQ